jgi:hypothetical protein
MQWSHVNTSSPLSTLERGSRQCVTSLGSVLTRTSAHSTEGALAAVRQEISNGIDFKATHPVKGVKAQIHRDRPTLIPLMVI